MHEYPGESITARQTTPIDRLQWNVACWFSHDYSQVVTTARTTSGEILSHVNQFSPTWQDYSIHGLATSQASHFARQALTESEWAQALTATSPNYQTSSIPLCSAVVDSARWKG